MSELTKDDVAFLEQAANEGSAEDVIAARELAAEAGHGIKVKVLDEDSGKEEIIDVKEIGEFPVGQLVKVVEPNSLSDNWRVNNH